MGKPITYQIGDRPNFNVVLSAELNEFWQSGHCAVWIQYFTQRTGRFKSTEFGEIIARFGMAGAG